MKETMLGRMKRTGLTFALDGALKVAGLAVVEFSSNDTPEAAEALVVAVAEAKRLRAELEELKP